jgi:hypothetical protein
MNKERNGQRELMTKRGDGQSERWTKTEMD